MLELAATFWRSLDRQQRIHLCLLALAVIAMACLEVVNIGAVMPFLGLAADPASVQSRPYLYAIYQFFGFESVQSFLIFLGLAVFTLMLLSNAWIAFTTLALTRFVWNWNHLTSTRLLRRYLYQPYSYFTTRNSTDLSKNILSEVHQLSAQLLGPAILGFGRGVVVVGIILLLLFTDPAMALVVSVAVGGTYGLVFLVVRKWLTRIGRQRVEANRNRFSAAAAGFGGIIDVKLLGKEEHFIKLFEDPSKQFSRHSGSSQLVSQLPRYGVESVAFGAIILLIVGLMARTGDLSSVLPVVGVYAFAGFRLLPAMQQAFRGFAQIRFAGPALRAVMEDSMWGTDISTEPPKTSAVHDSVRIVPRENIKLSGVSYSYPGASNPSLQNVSLSIEANSIVGLVGKTGSGKTTLVNIILGLIEPTDGIVSVDDATLGQSEIRNWQSSVGFVPQNIFLLDATIAENVGYGIPLEEIDMDRVASACRLAKLDALLESGEGLLSRVGENGRRLSGGQRQRIGIARALYRDPHVLVFDEATSSLDASTEDAVIDAITTLRRRKTIIMIAHRISTLKACDTIFMVREGRIVERGSYFELTKGQGVFAELSARA